jgi:hypothetical protein
MNRSHEVHAGDRVRWTASGAAMTGRVLRVATCTLGLSTGTFEASHEAPRLLIRRDSDGALFALKPTNVRALH